MSDQDFSEVFSDSKRELEIDDAAVYRAASRKAEDRITTLLAVIEQCELCLRSIVGDRTKEHFKGNGPGAIAGEFDVKNLHMALDALAAIKKVKESK